MAFLPRHPALALPNRSPPYTNHDKIEKIILWDISNGIPRNSSEKKIPVIRVIVRDTKPIQYIWNNTFSIASSDILLLKNSVGLLGEWRLFWISKMNIEKIAPKASKL